MTEREQFLQKVYDTWPKLVPEETHIIYRYRRTYNGRDPTPEEQKKAEEMEALLNPGGIDPGQNFSNPPPDSADPPPTSPENTPPPV